MSTDVHGNDADMARLEEVFHAEQRAGIEVHWAILGDIVHAPNQEAREQQPELYDFDDGSIAIVDRILRLRREHPSRIHFVLGNHDHGHVGGPHTHKFHDDEVVALESKLTSEERARLRELLEPALLVVVAPCGVLLTHGAPDESLEDVRALDDAPLAIDAMTSAQRRTMRALLTSYGQTDVIATAMLANVSRALGLDIRVVIHGHDRDESGVFREGAHQLLHVHLRSAPREQALRASRPGVSLRWGRSPPRRRGAIRAQDGETSIIEHV